jgi:hypothetical protein
MRRLGICERVGHGRTGRLARALVSAEEEAGGLVELRSRCGTVATAACGVVEGKEESFAFISHTWPRSRRRAKCGSCAGRLSAPRSL